MNPQGPVHFILPQLMVAGGIENLKQVQAELKPAVDEAEFEYTPQWGQTHQISNLEKGWNSCVIKDYNMEELEAQIYDACRNLTNGEHFSYAMNSWITKYNKGDFAHTHNHLPATFSGVYCYDVDPMDTSRFYFDNGNTMEQFKLRTGDLMIWKSHLPHGVLRHTRDDPRYTVSFNIIAFNEDLRREPRHD